MPISCSLRNGHRETYSISQRRIGLTLDFISKGHQKANESYREIALGREREMDIKKVLKEENYKTKEIIDTTKRIILKIEN